MNTKISKKEVILGLHKSGKTLNEIQATLIIMFEDDPIRSTHVNTKILKILIFLIIDFF